METQIVANIVVLALLILTSAFFSATETAFSSLNRIRIRHMAEDGSLRAAKVLALHDDYDRLIATSLIGNNVVNLSAASLSAALFIRLLGDIGTLVSTLVITLLVLILGEMLPKSLAREAPERFALFAVTLLPFFVALLSPLSAGFAHLRRLMRLVMINDKEEPSITEEELLSLVEEAEQEGAIDEEDKQLIESVIEFNDLKASDILIPRLSVLGVALENLEQDMADIFLNSGYSRIPVFQESLDDILGVVHLRDYFNYRMKKGTPQEFPLEEVIAPAVFAAPSMRISGLLKLLQGSKSHIAIISDEYGGTAGIVTMEDILEELVGEIWDENDEIIHLFVPLENNKHRVLCDADIDELFDYLGLKRVASDAKTVGGWIMDMLEKIPEEGDTLVHEGMLLTVHKVKHRRVLECIVELLEEPPS